MGNKWGEELKLQWERKQKTLDTCMSLQFGKWLDGT